METKLLKLGVGNAKLKNDVGIFDVPAGHTCPFSKDCAEKVDRFTGKLIKNPKAKFRCFAATSELISAAARRKRWHNFELLKEAKTSKEMAKLIIDSINANELTKIAPKFRVHSSGDFFNQTYFNAWIMVANAMPEKIFYAYTKSFRFWVAKLNEIPENLHLVASRGSKDDELIEKYNLKSVEIVFSEEEAIKKGLEIDHDDSHVYDRNVHKFALLLHGTQKAGSEASRAISEMRKNGVFGYQRGKIGKGRKAA
jgi:hypothetical protein